MGTTRVRALVTGTVQGVFFRASAVEEARARGLTGWVRNLPDGGVEVEAQGPAEQVDDLVAWLRVGPPAAAVAEVDTAALAPVDGERGFALR
jgi:acylphosphatase